MIGIAQHAKRTFDRTQRFAMTTEIAEHGAAPVQCLGAVRLAMQPHLDRSECSEIIAGRRCDLALEQPRFDTVGAQLQRLIDGRVRFRQHRVVACAEQLARLIEQAL